MTKEKSTAEVVLEAVEDLHAQEQVVTRETLADLLDMKMMVIDDRLGYLVDSGQILRVQRGVYVPAPKHRPARIITKTLLPGGTVSIEIGDDHVILLTPRENRMLGELMAGAGSQYASIEMGHQAADAVAGLHQQIKQLRRDLSSMKKSRRPVESSEV